MSRIKKPVSFAFGPELIAIIDKLSKELGLSKSQVVELAINELNKRGIKKEQLIKTITISD